MKKSMNSLGIALAFFGVFVFAFSSTGDAAPYVGDLALTVHSGGIMCDYTLGEDPETGDNLTAATAWYKDGAPLMVLYLPFEGGSINSLLDYSGNANPVEIYGEWSDPEWKSNGGPDGSGAYEFDGNDAFDAGDIFPIKSSYTKTAWIYKEILYPEYQWNNIISGHSHDANNHCFKVNPDGCLGAGHNAGVVMVSDPDPILEKTWYFVAVTFDYSTGAMRLYKNGELVNSDTLPVEYWDVTDPGVYIGRMETFWMWQGKLDDIRIYDFVLSAGQIQSMYENGANAIAPSEVQEGEEWQAAVTPFSTTEAGDTVLSAIVTMGDDDADGVPNADDLCPDTPAGTEVDVNGCPRSEDDLDGDGVSNDVDLCPDTPIGEEADADGCSASQRDTDGDGVTDDLDLCPGTPDGAEVDADGCSGLEIDSDSDGVPDYMEQGPDPENPDPEYDGDGDGVADSQQGNVVSCFSYDDLCYMTLVVTAPAGATLAGVEFLEPPDALPDGMTLPYGNIAFTIENVAVGGEATVEVRLHDGKNCETYYKYGFTPDNQTAHWYEFLYDDTTKIGAEVDGNVITLHFVDGEMGDDDLTADGVIMDDGAPANKTPDITPEDTGGGGSSGGCFISTVASGSVAGLQVMLLISLLGSVIRFGIRRGRK